MYYKKGDKKVEAVQWVGNHLITERFLKDTGEIK